MALLAQLAGVGEIAVLRITCEHGPGLTQRALGLSQTVAGRRLRGTRRPRLRDGTQASAQHTELGDQTVPVGRLPARVTRGSGELA